VLRWRSGSIVDFGAESPLFEPRLGQKVFNIRNKRKRNWTGNGREKEE